MIRHIMGQAFDGVSSRDRTRYGNGAGLSLILLLGINLFNYIDRQVLAAVEPNIRAQLIHDSPEIAKTKTGFLSTAFLLSYMVMAPLFGYLADRMSRWLLVGLAVGLWSLASGASGLALTYGALLLSRLFVGVGEAAYGPAAPTIISDLYPIQRRGKMLTWFYLAIPVGSALGYVLGAWMCKLNPQTGWRWAFYCVLPPGILLGGLCFLFKDPSRGQSDAGHRPVRRARFQDYRTLFSTPSYMLDTLGMAAMTFAIGGMSYWMPAYLQDRLKNNHSWAGNAYPAGAFFGMIVAVAGLTATLLGGIVADKARNHIRGAYFVVSSAGILLSVLFIILMLCCPFPLAWLWIFLAVFCLFFNTGPSNTILANVTHPAIRSTAFAVNIFIIHIFGDVPSPPLLGYLSDHYHSWTQPFAVVCALTFLGGLLWLWGALYLDRDTALVMQRLGDPSPQT